MESWYPKCCLANGVSPIQNVLYEETFDDNIPIYCELVFLNCDITESVNGITEVKFNIVWEEISDDQLEAYGNIIDKFSVELCSDLLSCYTVKYDDALHHQQID